MLDPDYSADSIPTYCALVNDNDNKILGEIIEHLGLLENGGLKPELKQTSIVPCYRLQLNTKYYTCAVPLLSYKTIDHLRADYEKSDRKFEILACLFCAPKELTQDFLGLVSKCSSLLDKADVKALILRDNEIGEGDGHSQRPNEEVLNRFALSRGIELINLAAKKDYSYEEEGLTGIARVVELIETVNWPNLKLKPNPVYGKEHQSRIRKLIEAEETDGEEEQQDMTRGGTFGSKMEHWIGSQLGRKSEQMDYPDSDDEEAIMDWFDKPSTHSADFRSFRANTSRHIGVSDLFEQKGEQRDANFPTDLNEVQGSEPVQINDQLPFKDRVDVCESIAYNLMNPTSSPFGMGTSGQQPESKRDTKKDE